VIAELPPAIQPAAARSAAKGDAIEQLAVGMRHTPWFAYMIRTIKPITTRQTHSEDLWL
jgi:hypothetical protein